MKDRANDPPMTCLDQVLRFCVESKWEDFPAEVQQQAKRSFLDALGCIIGGADVPITEITRKFVSEQFCSNGKVYGTVLVTGEKVSIVGASLVNGMAACALDMDDGHNVAAGHPGAGVLPGLIAMTEMPGANVAGKAFLTAVVIANEIAIRAGMARKEQFPTYHPTGSWSVHGITAASGVLLGLDSQTVCHAMGTAEYHSTIGPMTKGIQYPCMLKDAMGWGVMTGVSSVLMAREGFTGIKPLFDDAKLNGLGKDYQFMNIYFKPFSACRWSQPAIMGALKVQEEMKKSGLGIDSIEKLEIGTFKEASKMSLARPKCTEEAYYGMAYMVAVALIDGEVGPKQILPPRIFDEDVLKLCDKVTLAENVQFTKEYPAIRKAEVTVTTVTGKMFCSGPSESRWEKRTGLPTDDELTEKFMSLSEPVIGKSASEEIARAVWNCENIDDITEVLKLVRRG